MRDIDAESNDRRRLPGPLLGDSSSGLDGSIDLHGLARAIHKAGLCSELQMSTETLDKERRHFRLLPPGFGTDHAQLFFSAISSGWKPSSGLHCNLT
jgi:hypothetical protein